MSGTAENRDLDATDEGRWGLGPAGRPDIEDGADSPSEFGRIVQIMRSNERLASDLQVLNMRLAHARAHLSRPDCHRTLIGANIALLKSKHSGLLALLRANRIEALAILASDSPPRSRPDR